MVQSVITNARKSGAPKAFDKAWVKILQTHLGAWKHAEFGLGTSLMQAQRYGYTQMINNATLTNSSYKLRLAQDGDQVSGEAWIRAGRLTVNGQPAVLGQKVLPSDHIRLDDRPVRQRAAADAACIVNPSASAIASRCGVSSRTAASVMCTTDMRRRYVEVPRAEANRAAPPVGST